MGWPNDAVRAVIPAVLLVTACGGSDERRELSAVSPLAYQVVQAVAEGDELALRALLKTHMVPCVAEDSGEAGPFCDPPGRIAEAISVAGCQGGWAAEIDAWVGNITATAGAPLALAQLPEQRDWPSGLQSQTVLVFSPAGSDVTRSVAIFLDDVGIVRSQVGCRRADQFLVDNDGQSLRILWRAPAQ